MRTSKAALTDVTVLFFFFSSSLSLSPKYCQAATSRVYCALFSTFILLLLCSCKCERPSWRLIAVMCETDSSAHKAVGQCNMVAGE